MHAEFSSILLRNFGTSFPTARWAQVNGGEWEYVGFGEGHDRLNRRDLLEYTEDLLKVGCLIYCGLKVL